MSEERNNDNSPLIASKGMSLLSSPILSKDLLLEPSGDHHVNHTDDYIPFLRSGTIQDLFALVNNSPTLSRIVGDKTDWVVGDGFILNEGKANSILSGWRKFLKVLNLTDEQDVIDSLNKVNRFNETIIEVSNKFQKDLETTGNAVVEVVVVDAPLTKEMSKVELYHVNLEEYRPKKRKKSDKIHYGAIRPSWKKNSSMSFAKDNETIEIPLYPNFEKINGAKRSLIHVKTYAPGHSYWGLPGWIAAHSFAEMEYKVSTYNNAKLTNGYSPSAIVQFFGSLSKDKADKLIKDFKKCFTSEKNTFKMFVQVLSDEKYKAHIQTFEDKNDGSYMDLCKVAAQQIVTASRWTMSLAGYASAGKLGGNEQMQREFEMIYNTLIYPAQTKLLSKVINPFFYELSKAKGWNEDRSLTISNTMPISFMGEINIDNVLTLDEKREVVGYDAASEEQKLEISQAMKATLENVIKSTKEDDDDSI